MEISLRAFKRGLILFWALWFTIVLASNITDGLKSRGLVDPSVPFASGNFAVLQAAVGKFGFPPQTDSVLFSCIVVWQTTAAILLWRAFIWYRRGWYRIRPINTAFACGIALWAAFLVADELFVAYESGIEGSHFHLFIAQIVSFVAIHALPDTA